MERGDAAPVNTGALPVPVREPVPTCVPVATTDEKVVAAGTGAGVPVKRPTSTEDVSVPVAVTVLKATSGIVAAVVMTDTVDGAPGPSPVMVRVVL